MTWLEHPALERLLPLPVLALQQGFGNRQRLASAVRPPLADLLLSAGGALLLLEIPRRRARRRASLARLPGVG